MNAAVIYWSKTGNTERVAQAIKEGLEASGVDVLLRTTENARGVDFFHYDLVCVGFPSYWWHVPEPVDTFLTSKFSDYSQKGYVKMCAPKVPGKHALVFCTYSGPHTGINEAIPAGKYVGQFFEHMGFTVLDEWYILGEYHGAYEINTKGKMGDLRGRPNEEDLRKVRQDVSRLLARLQTSPTEQIS